MNLSAISLAITRPSGGFSPLHLFAAGEAGAWFDPSDLSTMFQDSAGTTPVTAVEQPVGLWFDKSKGAKLGTNLGVTDAFPITKSAGQFFAASTAPQAGVWYELTYVITASDYTGDLYFEPAAGPFDYAVLPKTVGTHRRHVRAVDAQTELLTLGGGAPTGSITFSDVTCKPIPGYHAFQATSAARMVLKQEATGKALSADGVDDAEASATGGGSASGFYFCAGIKVSGGAGTARTLWSDAGTNTGYRVRINASDQLELAAGNGTAYTTVATVATLPIGNYVVSGWDDGTNLNVQLGNGTIAQIARPVVAAGTAGFTLFKDNGAASGFFNGMSFGQVYRTTVPSEAQRSQTKQYMAMRAGVTL